MHDVDRGGNSTARRLAALAALRKTGAEDAHRDTGEPDGSATPGVAGRQERTARPDPRSGAADTARPAGRDPSAGMFAAVEAAIRKSRVEFLFRLVEYREQLDCEGLKAAVSGGPDVPLDEAQFIAHRIAGVGKTLGFPDLGEAARQTEAAISAYKLERTAELRKMSVVRICRLAGLIEAVCAEHQDCLA